MNQRSKTQPVRIEKIGNSMISEVALGRTKTLPESLLPLQSLRELVLLPLFRGFVLDELLLLPLGFALTSRLGAECLQRLLHTSRAQHAP